MLTYLTEALTKSITTVFYLALILMAIMIVTEYANHFNLLEKLISPLSFLPRSLKISQKATFPLIIGLFLGITYGAAIIIDYTRKGYLSKKDMTLMGVFLAINHSMIEDNLLLAAVGANLLILFPLRFVLAFLVTRAVSYFYDRNAARLPNTSQPYSPD